MQIELANDKSVRETSNGPEGEPAGAGRASERAKLTPQTRPHLPASQLHGARQSKSTSAAPMKLNFRLHSNLNLGHSFARRLEESGQPAQQKGRAWKCARLAAALANLICTLVASFSPV